MENNFIVYMHIFPNDKKYVGITSRKTYLRWRSGYGYKEQQHMWRAIQKYGWENVKHEILFENLSKEEACKKEIELIEKYKTTNDCYGYNRSVGGEISSLGVVCKKETKEKIREAGKGRKFTDETKQKISKELIGNKNGSCKVMSEELKQKLREAKLGKKRSKETIEKLREAGKEHWNNLSEEKRKELLKNLTGAKKGHKVSQETREKLREAKLGTTQTQETIEKRKKTIEEKKKNGWKRDDTNRLKKVMCIETGEIFNSVSEAMNKYNLTTLSGHLRGRYKTCKGKHYIYYKNEVQQNELQHN